MRKKLPPEAVVGAGVGEALASVNVRSCVASGTLLARTRTDINPDWLDEICDSQLWLISSKVKGLAESESWRKPSRTGVISLTTVPSSRFKTVVTVMVSTPSAVAVVLLKVTEDCVKLTLLKSGEGAGVGTGVVVALEVDVALVVALAVGFGVGLVVIVPAIVVVVGLGVGVGDGSGGGVGAGGVTTNVSDREVEPVLFLAVMVYVVVVSGLTDCVPSAASLEAPGSSVISVASLVFQVMVELSPRVIWSGPRAKPTNVGAPTTGGGTGLMVVLVVFKVKATGIPLR